MRSIALMVLLAWGTYTLAEGELSPWASPNTLDEGYQLLVTKPLLPRPELDDEVFAELWKTWEEPLRSQAAAATPDERRRMAFERYGLTEAPGRPGSMPLQYTPDGKGGWVMNCFSCHGGKVAGQVIPGVPNSHYDLQTFSEEILQTKFRMGKRLGYLDRGVMMLVPLGSTRGSTNAIIFGVALNSLRDPDLNFKPRRPLPPFIHHDHDAPPWWNVKHKTWIYADGFVKKSHRSLMQFSLVEDNGPSFFHEREPDFVKIMDWIENLEAPKWPFGGIDSQLAAEGKVHFNRVCSSCHGTYGPDGSYPNKFVHFEDVGTDRVRFDAVPVEAREAYGTTWFASHQADSANPESVGYVAPPLDGVWASAPYFHNGSVPTLWHVLNPDSRPVVWKRTEDGYDQERVGIEVVEMEEVPEEAASRKQRRWYFDTRKFGKSRAGHDYPEELTAEEKRAVLEYLKTL